MNHLSSMPHARRKFAFIILSLLALVTGVNARAIAPAPAATHALPPGCIGHLTSTEPAEKDLIQKINAVSPSGSLDKSSWHTAKGIEFSFSEEQNGPIAKVTGLPDERIQEFAKATRYSAETIRTAIANGLIKFNAQSICIDDSKNLKLTLVGNMLVKGGEITLSPGPNGSLNAAGTLAGSPINESVTAK